MTLYNTLGAINTAFIFISLFGVFSQLQTLWKRKQDATTKHCASELLSLNQFTVSFLAYLSFFVYGYSIEPFNHYIVWPRLVASLLVGFILYEIWKDRRNTVSVVCLLANIVVLLCAISGLFFGKKYTDEGQIISTSLILVITVLIAQGYYHQIQLIIRSGRTGAVDLKMSQFILMMDISTIAFSLCMGFEKGWPLLVLATISGITKIYIIYLFWWVKHSTKAALNRKNHAF